MKRNLLIALALLPFTFFAQQAKEYPDGHGKMRSIPSGDISFADSVVSYKMGDPAPIEKVRNSKLALGLPDYDGYDGGFVSLGGGGELILFFKDNALVNLKGPDLYIFELGKYVEETILSVSKDGKTWVNVGKISGGNAEVDMGDSIPEGEVYRYIKLKDASTLKVGKDGYPGADIDAVAAIGSAKSISINSTFLFDVGKSVLKPGAKSLIDKIATDMNNFPGYSIRVEGHCDSTGNKEMNRKLAQDRANAVKTYLSGKLKSKGTKIFAKGYSDELPVATNNTPAGREKNRRVELYLIPPSSGKPSSPEKK